jgi:hypothetical protein
MGYSDGSLEDQKVDRNAYSKGCADEASDGIEDSTAK